MRARRPRVSERNKQKDGAEDHETESGKSGRELSCMRKRECIALEIKGTFVALFSSIRPSPDNGGRELVLSFSRDVRPLRTSTFLFSLWLYVYIIEERERKKRNKNCREDWLKQQHTSYGTPFVRAIKIFRYVVSLKITIFKFQKSVRAGTSRHILRTVGLLE